MLNRLKFVVVIALAAANGAAMAQPASQPATTSAPARHVVVVPPGFNKISISGRNVLVEPADESWARTTLQDLTPTTQPTTTPSTIENQIQNSKEQLTARMMKDLALTDPAPIDKLLNDKLATALKKLEDITPPVFYLTTTEARLKELIKNGWSDPRLYYNRIADKVQISLATLSASGESDDVLVPVLILPGDSVEARSRELSEVIHDTESNIALLMSDQAINGTDVGISSFILDQVFIPMKLQRDQEWIEIGLAGVLSTRYTALLTGIPQQSIMQIRTTDNPRNPVHSATIDLVHPMDLATMRTEAIGYYADAYRRKAFRVMLSWTTRAGDDAIPKLIAELRKGVPPDGPGLVQKIQQISGIDLSGDVAAGK